MMKEAGHTKMIQMNRTVILIFLLISLVSCGGYELQVDSELRPYFRQFAEEAKKRGITFDNEKEQIEGYIKKLNNPTAVDLLGYCQYPSERLTLHTITIDKTFWASATDLQKEYVVFHELGHCFLKRDHISPVPVDSLGRCGSIMAAGNASCKSLDVYTTKRRKELLDELFRR